MSKSFLPRLLHGADETPETEQNAACQGDADLQQGLGNSDILSMLSNFGESILDFFSGTAREQAELTSQLLQLPSNSRGGFAARLVAQTEGAPKWSEIFEHADLQRAITRAEAATLVVRILGISGALDASEVAYFYDVPQSEWFFESAHLARLYGIFRGGDGDNRFRPHDALSEGDANIVQTRALGARCPVPLEQQTNGSKAITDVDEAAIPVYPGESASVSDKHDFYTRLLDRMGYGAAIPVSPGERMLIAIRGFTAENLAALNYQNDANLFNDMFVVLGSEADGKPFVSEYRGSVDPGVGGEYALAKGEYDYAYKGDGFNNSLGTRTEGAYSRMTWETQQSFDTIHDTNRDGSYDLESGDRSFNEKNNEHYLLHYGGDKEEGSVGGWSYGCQVVAGKDETGRRNVDTMHDDLNHGTFHEVLLDGRDLVEKLGARKTS